jgi:hypothetical protein
MDEDSKTGKTDRAKAAYSGFRSTQAQDAETAAVRPRVGAAGTVARKIPGSKSEKHERESWRLPE